MKIKETQFVQLPLSGTVNNLEIIVNSFSLFPSSIEILWKISGEVASKEGSMTLPNEIVTSWGTDDSLIADYVLTQLGLTLDSIVIETPVVNEEPIV